MATVKPIKPKKPVDYVAYEPVMLAVSKARACAWLLQETGESMNGKSDNLILDAIRGHRDSAPIAEEILEWLHSISDEQLRACLDDIEREYRKLGANLLQKELAAADLKPKDSA